MYPNIEQKFDNIKWDANIRDKIQIMMAYIFALWTLQNAQYYYDAKYTHDQKGLFDTAASRPSDCHIFALTLAVTCCVLALLGFDVNCASYSEYLSTRDFKYLILPNKEKSLSKISRVTRAKILLIDEVDVFFNKEFYGGCYSPAATIRHDSVTKLIDFIWKNKSVDLTLKAVKESSEYKACFDILEGCCPLLDEAIKDMLNDVQKFESHGYQVSNDKIGYKEQDSICYNVRYGYKTLFAYYHEHEEKRISTESFKNNICLSFQIGNFSYAEVPKNFSYIMGVSGTLKTLSESEQKVIENDYNISKHTYIPSLFGKNNLVFAEQQDIRIVDESDYFIALEKEIEDRLVGKNIGTKRAVLVFFETKKQLMEFYESSNFLPIKDNAIVMTEENSFQEKESLIKRAVTSGQVGLFTKEFGRGTDFVCRDQIVSANGGPHVIQTFLSEELSEEMQIKGRTARQGGYGSYSLILCDKSLEKFLITVEDIAKAKKFGNVYMMLDEKRNKFFKDQYAENQKFVEKIKQEHKSANDLITMLKSKRISEVKIKLCEQNRGATDKASSRTVVLMDATGSMSHLLQKAKNTVSTMFERITDILRESGYSPNIFEMQFVVYRNYNAPEDKILQVSPWESKPDNLRSFMENVIAEHGMGNEAIEVGLAHVNRECEIEEVSQVILIGDAPANTREEVTKRRMTCSLMQSNSVPKITQKKKGFLKVLKKKRMKKAPESEINYWQNTELFSNPTYYEDELLLLKKRGIPVHAFFVDTKAKQNFEGIARITGGRCKDLDINSVKGADLLTNLISEEVLRNAGGSKGDALVDAYRTKFSKSYT
ncbi:hypothetical protein RFI_30511 [Reticulomyxa filosa]|uniref:SecA family profile domain-containing protein n=1 Tax=Reticulomyxa filosa TaxID=46433 RepID=X6M1Q2_RETFI|nr:hypothetical protein RFI_30511 [Reticulomyxa filosa]|eukprot:ETO06880.1 hypothetical protein RFI_30511 [Reticulomyxa filosa]